MRQFSLIVPTKETAGTDHEVASPKYPVNARGQVDFASVMLTLDHMLSRDDFHISQKIVKSTQHAAEALVAMMTNYYGDSQMLVSKAVRDILNDLDSNPDNTFAVYIVPKATTDRFGGQIVQVISSTRAWKRFIDHPAFGNGSELLATDRLVGYISKLATSVTPLPRLTKMVLAEEPGEQDLNEGREA